MTQQAFGFRAGFPTADGFPVVFLSLSNADLEISCNGFKDTISGGDWVEVGTDHPGAIPRLGYVASTIVTGQAPFARHNYYVQQNGTTYGGSAMSAARRGDNFSLFLDTCRNNTFAPESSIGSHAHMKAFHDAGGVIQGIIHPDDHYGYTDLQVLDDTAGTGHASTGTPSITQLEYDYAMGYFAAFGLFVNETGGTFSAAQWGQNEINIWAMRNLNVIPQFGDHDVGGNEMGWDVNPVGNAGFRNARGLWDLIMGPLQPPSISVLSNTDVPPVACNAWAGTLGAVTLIAPDAITLSSGDANDVNIANPDYGPATMFSPAQIDECLTAANTDAPHKFMILANSIKFLAAPTKYFSGAQNPIKNARLSEFQRLFTRVQTGGDPLSLMANPKTNGLQGTLGTLHGDQHVNIIAQHRSPAYAGNHAENFYSICVGTGNGSINFGVDPSIDAGTVYDDSTVEVVESASKHADPLTNGGGHWWSVRIDIDDAIHPPEALITDKDRNDGTLWSKKLVQYRGGNTAVLPSVDVSAKGAYISTSDANLFTG